MYYRFILVKDGQTSGLFHPKQKWGVKKENGLYDVVRKNFSDLPYIKESKTKTTSWFKKEGLNKFEKNINELKLFYNEYKIKVVCISREKVDNIIMEDQFQVWCKCK